MAKAGALVCLLICGCHSLQVGESDPLVEGLVKDGEKQQGTPLDTAAILREIKIGTPLAKARSILEGHGFSCWAEVPDEKGVHLHCTAYKHTSRAYKVVVKLYYDIRRKQITEVEATVEQDTWHHLRLS